MGDSPEIFGADLLGGFEYAFEIAYTVAHTKREMNAIDKIFTNTVDHSQALPACIDVKNDFRQDPRNSNDASAKPYFPSLIAETRYTALPPLGHDVAPWTTLTCLRR